MVYLVQNKEDLDQQLADAGEKLIVIDFYANWCGPCKIIAPKLEELALQYADRAVVLKVNVDENEDITVEYNITSMPTFVFIKNGEVLEIFVGGNSDKLAKSMEKYVGGTDVPPEQLQTVSSSPSESGASSSGVCELRSHAEAECEPAMDGEGVLEN
ncbi:thioredoxin-2 [Scaptodrosophila lebanonensis]|uniref:Thioredoxin-2 n=1 Tax=Drosophila lebanonensis TaxID=7225 RepID=A0A6J2TVC2_DROLE|nr:thioredoxin-2 [Scaptodrosophila lebanonensis]